MIWMIRYVPTGRFLLGSRYIANYTTDDLCSAAIFRKEKNAIMARRKLIGDVKGYHARAAPEDLEIVEFDLTERKATS